MKGLLRGPGNPEKPGGKERRGLTKRVGIFLAAVFLLSAFRGAAAGGGLIGPPQSVSRETGGLNTAVGYDYREEAFGAGRDLIFRQRGVYSQLGYGAGNWEVCGRIGMADLQISEAFRSSQPLTAVSKNDFDARWKPYGTLGAKGFFPLDGTFGFGAFFQGSYFFKDFKDHASGARDGAPFTAELKVKDLWEVTFGLSVQAAVPAGIRLYGGPLIRYAEAKLSPSPNVPGLAFSAGDIRVKNETVAGGFGGVNIPLPKGFRLAIEGRFIGRFSAGAAVSFSY